MQKTTDKPLFKKLICVLNDANLYGRRHDYAWRHSNHRTESTKELTDTEMSAIIKEITEANNTPDDPLDKMRKKVLAQAHTMGWELPDGKINMAMVNRFCETKGPYKKKLDAHNKAELTKLVSVFEKMKNQFLNKI